MTAICKCAMAASLAFLASVLMLEAPFTRSVSAAPCVGTGCVKPKTVKLPAKKKAVIPTAAKKTTTVKVTGKPVTKKPATLTLTKTTPVKKNTKGIATQAKQATQAFQGQSTKSGKPARQSNVTQSKQYVMPNSGGPSTVAVKQPNKLQIKPAKSSAPSLAAVKTAKQKSTLSIKPVSSAPKLQVPSANCGSSKTGACSDIRLKRDIVGIGRLGNGIELYRFRYKWSDRDYVGVMAQDVARVVPAAVMRGSDGYLRVNYARLGLRLQTWDEWQAANPR